MEKLVTIATFFNLSRAYLFKARLEAEGIICHLRDEQMNNLLPVGSFGGIKVEVPLSQSIRALDIFYEVNADDSQTEI